MHILYDAASVQDPRPELFCPADLEARGIICGRAAGRGTTYFLTAGSREWVLRHYRRGGLPAKIFSDQYVGLRPERSRAWKEWRLLTELYQRNFPVPRPVAACTKLYPGFYRCDLITERIPEARSLADILKQQSLSCDLWHQIGACVRMFHDAGVYHADLNAQNILLDDKGAVFLIDFDRCDIRTSGQWKSRNIERLHRSFAKLVAVTSSIHFNEADWKCLLSGYSR